MAAPRMLVSLRHRNARRFFLGLLLSNVGTWMQMTASSLVIYQLTGRATDTGINLLCQFLPMLLLGSWAGAVADRRDKRRMALLTQSLLAVQALVLGVVTLLGWVSLPLFFGMSLALGVIGAFDNPARRGFVLELVEPHEIGNAVALNTAVMTGSRIVGPALAAFLEGPLGAGWLFMANGVSFLFLLVPLVRIDVEALHPSPPARRGGTPVRDALRFITGDPRLFRTFAVFALVSTFAFNYSVSLLKIADQRFDDRQLFGVLLAMTGVGSLVGSLLTAGRERVTVAWFYGSGLLLGVSGLALSWAPSTWAAVLLAIPVGIGGAGFIAGQNAVVQQEAPADMRGRLLALGAVAFLGSTPVGSPITGWIADHVSSEWSLAYGSLVAIPLCVIGLMAPGRQRPADAAG
ncbi:MAG: hypothetical protein RLZ04_2641 [Actinomycetota bacterium]